MKFDKNKFILCLVVVSFFYGFALNHFDDQYHVSIENVNPLSITLPPCYSGNSTDNESAGNESNDSGNQTGSTDNETSSNNETEDNGNYTDPNNQTSSNGNYTDPGNETGSTDNETSSDGNWTDSGNETSPTGNYTDNANETTPNGNYTNVGNETTHPVNLTKFDNGTYVDDFGYMIDDNDDGIFDKFYSNTTKEEIIVETKSNGAYLIDTNGDGEWEYVLDTASGSMMPYTVEDEEKQTPGFGFILLLVATIVIITFNRKKQPQ